MKEQLQCNSFLIVEILEGFLKLCVFFSTIDDLQRSF
jgi:hypothetical protein